MDQVNRNHGGERRAVHAYIWLRYAYGWGSPNLKSCMADCATVGDLMIPKQHWMNSMLESEFVFDVYFRCAQVSSTSNLVVTQGSGSSKDNVNSFCFVIFLLVSLLCPGL
jgi:hypothetical protein